MRFLRKPLLYFLVAAVVPFAPALAEAPSPAAQAADQDPWRFSLWVYGWIAGVDGSVSGGQLGAADVDTDVNLDLSDSFEDLSGFGFMAHFEARHGPLSLFFDGMYLSIDADRQPQFDGEANVELGAAILELGAAYAVVHAPLGEDSKRHFTAEVLGGARYAGVEIDVNRFTAGGAELSASGRRDWVDPFVGLRGRLDVTDNLYAFARGDVGGFGVGSDFVWNVNTGIGFNFTEHFGIAAGYRWLDYDFEEGDYTLDLQVAGPWLALVFNF